MVSTSGSGPALTMRVAFRYHHPMEPKHVRRVRKALGLTQSQFAELLGVHLVTVKKWETGAQGLRSTSERLIRLLVAQGTTARLKTRRRGGR